MQISQKGPEPLNSCMGVANKESAFYCLLLCWRPTAASHVRTIGPTKLQKQCRAELCGRVLSGSHVDVFPAFCCWIHVRCYRHQGKKLLGTLKLITDCRFRNRRELDVCWERIGQTQLRIRQFRHVGTDSHDYRFRFCCFLVISKCPAFDIISFSLTWRGSVCCILMGFTRNLDFADIWAWLLPIFAIHT